MKITVLCVLLACLVATQALSALDPETLGDSGGNDYALYDYADDSNEPANSKSIETYPNDADKQVEPDIEEALNNSNDDDKFDDYQIEDNRSNNADKEPVAENKKDAEPVPDDDPQANDDELAVIPLESNENNENTASEDTNDDDDSLDLGIWHPLPVPEDKLGAVVDSQEKVENKLEDLDDQPSANEDKVVSDEQSEPAPIDEIADETNKLLEESDNNFKADNYDDFNSDEVDKSFEELFGDENDTPDKVLGDLNDDLDKLFETLDKLSDNDSDVGENDENANNNDNVDDVQDYEEKNDRPYKEGNILSLRDDYENFDDSDLGDIFADQEENVSNEDEKNKEIAEPDTADDNKNAEEISPYSKDEETPVETVSAGDNNSDEFDYTGEIDKILSLHDNDEDDEKVDEMIDKLLRHSYGNDGLVDDQMPINEEAEMISTTGAAAASIAAISEAATTAASELSSLTAIETEVTATLPVELTTQSEERQTKKVDELNSSEYNDVMAQFAIANSEVLDTNSEGFVKNVAPIHITLSGDEPTVITSPDYPAAYPTNNIVDWIVEGPGMGIEMNVTHLQVNGAIGDYLLVKPGGIDASGSDGLIFSFRLNSVRKYRFLNVNRMFIRFQSYAGIQFYNGFSLSAKMIRPPKEEKQEVPDPEPVLQEPTETLIISLAGLSMPRFHEVKPAFRELVADMAQRYIEDNGIEPGLNSTLNVTQITKTAVCNIRWPNYETCVEVTFGVPLHYDEEVDKPRLTAEDLDEMWRTYIVKEPFSSRLSALGITEYAIPDDSTVLMVWLAIALGVLISMAMLAFALWRFRCFEDYTRMSAYVDTDSIQTEKKNLDLYPTPHQSLPPLYTDGDYKWADGKFDDTARVDMGGFANRSYVRDDIFEFDSDEDVIAPRNRSGVISPRDVYEV